MTDENQQVPNGEKKPELPEPFHYTASNPIPESPRGRLARAGQQIPKDEKAEEQPEPPRYTAGNLIPESPRGRVAQTGQQSPKDEKAEEQPEPLRFTAGTLIPESRRGEVTQAGQQDSKGEKAEEQPEPLRFTASNLIPESPRGRVAETGQQSPKEQKAEEQPEPPRYTASSLIPESPRGKVAQTKQQDSKGVRVGKPPEPLGYAIIEPPAEKPRGKAGPVKQQDPKGKKAEEPPEPLGYAIIEPPVEAPRGKAGPAKQLDSKGTKAEEPPEPLGYAIVEPAPESPQDKVVQAGQQDSEGGKAEEQPEPPHYAIIEPPPPPDIPAEANPPHLVSASADAQGEAPIQAPAIAPTPVAKASVAESRKPAPSRTWIYIVTVGGLGLLFGLAIAVIFSHMGGAPVVNDLGSFTSSAAGLKGHLVTKWDKKLEYRLTVEPSDPDHRAGFAFAVAHPPRPLSIELYLHDAQGFVLCSREVLLKYVPGNAPAVVAPNPEAQAGNADAANAAGVPAAHVEELLAAQEAERELGKEVFKNEIGPDGQIAGLDAQGEIQCPEKTYASVSSWSFVPDFPSLAEQDALVKGQNEAQTSGGESTGETPVSRRKAPRIAAPPPLAFTIEGDDAIVELDVSRGIIETRAGKTFFFDKTSGDINNPKWQDYPVDIHYKCDQTATCTIAHSGAGVLRVRMRR
jgi:hypothetical protein